MEYTAEHIARITGGKVEGNAKVKVSRLSKIEDSEPGSLSFLSNSKYNNYLYATRASVVLVDEDFVPSKPFRTTLIRVPDAYKAFTKLLTLFNGKEKRKNGVIDPSAVISSGAVLDRGVSVGAYSVVESGVRIGSDTCIHPHVVIEQDVSIGTGCILYPGVRIYRGCRIGNGVIIHANAIIGSDGFGFAPSEDGTYEKIPQTGNVVIGDKAEIGAGTVIDRATLGSTLIGEGVKLDNLIQIAHNVEIGAHTVIAAQTGIAGSTKIGTHCVIGGQAGIAGHLKIGNRVKIQAQSGIGKNLPDDAVVQGTPAFSYTDWNRSYVLFKKLPQIISRLENAIKKQ